MKRHIWKTLAQTLVLGTFWFGSSAYAEIATVHLADGSKIRGEVVSLQGGSYTIQTESVGKMVIPQDNIMLVQYGAASAAASSISDAAPSGSPAGLDMGALASLQSTLMSDPDILSTITQLQSDPAIMALANDPELQQAIASGNIAELMSNDKIRQLMNHPAIKEIVKKAR